MIASLLALALALALAAPASAVKITLVHTSDVHGWIMPRPSKEDPSRMIGGSAALAAFYKSVPGPKLLTDAGDSWQGTPEGTLSKGRVAAEMMNAIGYDAVCPGNHDLDLGQGVFTDVISRLEMPVLAANIFNAKTGERVPYVKPWILKEVAGVKIGLFGLLTSHMPRLTFKENTAGLEFRDEIETAKEAVAELKKLGATVIILIDHVGLDRAEFRVAASDQRLAAEVPGIDIIAGGHMHMFMRQPYRDEKTGTIVFEPGAWLSAVSKVELNIDDSTKRLRSSSYTLVDLWIDEVGQDPQVAALVSSRTAEVSAVYDVVIATAEAFMPRDGFKESPLADWVMDCEKAKTGADLALGGGFGIRADLPKGPVTKRTIFGIAPFENLMVTLEMDGGQVREVLDHGAELSHALIQVSGASFRYDRKAPSGKRLRDVRIGGKPIDPRKIYKVATVDYTARGGEGYSPFARARKQENTGILQRDMLYACAREQRLIKVPKGGRMIPQEKPN